MNILSLVKLTLIKIYYIKINIYLTILLFMLKMFSLITLKFKIKIIN